MATAPIHPGAPDAGAPLVFFAAPDDPRDRLDNLLDALLARAGRPATRATVQRWVDEGRVLVAGRAVRASAAVSPGARVEITPGPPLATRAEPDASIDLRVVHEDAHLLVVDKPAGLVVHPARGHETGTLVNALLARGGFERAGADPRDPEGHLRPGIVHRLDKGTSGLLVVAKDATTREALKALFAAHTIDREYVALVEGEGRDATYDTPHARHATDRLRFTSHPELARRGKPLRRAVTHVRVLERLGAATLLACRLDTGRTHQIRVHLAEQAGTPILGDPVYGRTPRAPTLRALAEALGRQALHARVLGFVHPATGEAMRWTSPIPDDIERCLRVLRATRSST